MAGGRKKLFDENTALNAAMQVFWQKGYVGASLSDLTKNMGINKPSMYSAFGNKEALFVQATQCYIETQMQPNITLLFEEGCSLKQRLKNHMMAIVSMQCGANKVNPQDVQATDAKGCYLAFCQSELISGDLPELAVDILKKADELPSHIYTELFINDAESIAQGLNKNAQANALSVYTLLKGTASMARSGIAKSELEYSVDSIIAGIGVQ